MTVPENEKYFIIGGAGREDTESDFGAAADEIIALSGKKSPSFLYIGFAQLEPHHGFEYYGEVFADKGCRASYLTDGDIAPGGAAREKIGEADIIFLMGGNTRKLVDTLEGHGVSEMLRKAARRGCVMSGFSAGAICLCESGMSKDGDYYMQKGIGCLPFLFCPHPLTSPRRYASFCDEIKKRPDAVGIACDGAGIEIADGRYRAFVFNPGGCLAEIIRVRDGEIESGQVPREWRDIIDL